jgi:energy-coupling factor transport system ATP-binding protein
MHLLSESSPRLPQDHLLFELTNLSYTYPNGTIGINNLTINISRNDRIALVGQNGSGKSTLVRHLNGILPVQQGTLLYDGEPLTIDIINQIRLRLGILFQDPDNHLFCNTLYEDVAFGPMNQGLQQAEVDHLVKKYLAAVDLEPLMYKPAHLLSYGQKKRAAFAAILAMQPDVLVLDEPTANLDPHHERVFKELLTEFNGTLIVIDHDLLFLYDICERSIVLSGGHLHHDFSMHELVGHQQALHDHGLDFNFRFSCCGQHQPATTHHHHLPHTHDHDNKSHLKEDSSESILLEMQHYDFSYPDETPGIRDINFSIMPGETIALIGENGAGKSTLASCLIGLNHGDGYLLYKEKQLTKESRRQLWQHVGMVFQNSADQLFCPSCWEEVAFGPQQMKLSPQEIDARVDEALHLVQLTGYEKRVPLNMSGGERKRLAIAAALAMKPQLIILDEPTASLDPRSEELLIDILDHLPIARILITHDLFFISRLSDRTIVMHQGRIIRDYATADFLKDDHLQAENGLDYSYKNECFEELRDLHQQR